MSNSQAHVPMRAITRGPGYHWFGYYDKLQFDPTSRYVLAMAVDFEHRPPRPDDEIRIGMIDLEDGDSWRTIGTTTAWCWQQGCMLQWLPGSTSEVIWNERAGDRYVARINRYGQRGQPHRTRAGLRIGARWPRGGRPRLPPPQ